jgi:hypothetical protein
LVPSGEDLVALGPGGLVLEAETLPEARGVRVRSARVPVPGFYEIRAGDRTLLRRAVNVDAESESDLTPAGREELLQAFAGEQVHLVEPGDPLGSPVREARFGREIWRELVVLVLLLLLAEGWLSRRGVSA